MIPKASIRRENDRDAHILWSLDDSGLLMPVADLVASLFHQNLDHNLCSGNDFIHSLPLCSIWICRHEDRTRPQPS